MQSAYPAPPKRNKKTKYPPYLPLTQPELAAAVTRCTARQTCFQPLLPLLFPLGLPPPAALPLCLAVYDHQSFVTFLRLTAACSDSTWAPFLVPCADTLPVDQPFLLLHMRNDLDQLAGVSLVQAPPVLGACPPPHVFSPVLSPVLQDAPGAGDTPILETPTNHCDAMDAIPAPAAPDATAWARALFLPRHDAHPALHPLWAALDRLLFHGLGHHKRHAKIVRLNLDLQHLSLHGYNHFLQHAFLLPSFYSRVV